MSAVARGVWGVDSAITRGAVASAVPLPAGDAGSPRVLRLLASTAMMPTATCPDELVRRYAASATPPTATNARTTRNPFFFIPYGEYIITIIPCAPAPPIPGVVPESPEPPRTLPTK